MINIYMALDISHRNFFFVVDVAFNHHRMDMHVERNCFARFRIKFTTQRAICVQSKLSR